ncbi:hypothetical protein ACFL96_09635 [Thermoproteota archaeon]
MDYARLLKNSGRKLVPFFILIILLISNPCLDCLQASEKTPEKTLDQAAEQTPQEINKDILASIGKIITLSSDLCEELKDVLPQDNLWSASDRQKIENFLKINEFAKEDFNELSQYLGQSEDVDLDELQVSDLISTLKESLRDLLDEAHYVFDVSLSRLVSERLDSIEPQKMTQRELFFLSEDSELNTLVSLWADSHKYNEYLLKYNDLLLAEEAKKWKEWKEKNQE